MELQTSFETESEAETFLLELDNITHPLFPDPNNGAAFDPDSETSLAGSEEWAILTVSLSI
jgi:hypothetical protein